MIPSRVLVVDDYEPFRQLVFSLLERRADFKVIGQASDGLEAVQKAEDLRPDLILLDIGLPKLNGMDVARRLRKVIPETRILFLSQESSLDLVREALGLGAMGYVHKARVQSELLPAIDVVLGGRQFVSSGLEECEPSENTNTQASHHHEIQFYSDDTIFLYSFTTFQNKGGHMPMTETTVHWALKGRGYEFCNCDFGCGCNFGGFPNSKDGSCRAFVGMDIDSGSCGSIDFSRVKCAAIVSWPKAIHEGHGQCVFIVEPTATEKQIEALGQIFTGKLGGMPWELLGPTFEVKGLMKAKIVIEGSGPKSMFKAEGIGEGRGDTFKNPVTGEDHFANIDLPDGFIWKKGQCGQGTFRAQGAGVSVGAEKSNWILYNFDWTNG